MTIFLDAKSPIQVETWDPTIDSTRFFPRVRKLDRRANRRPAPIETWTTPHERRKHLSQFYYLPLTPGYFSILIALFVGL
jgi:hypothetical protein